MKTMTIKTLMFATVMLFLTSLASASDFQSENSYVTNYVSETKVDLTVSYWSYQGNSGDTGLLNDGDGDGDGDGESEICRARGESGPVTILWSAICWGGGSIEIEVPCGSVDVEELLT